jgi:hypothetical protein
MGSRQELARVKRYWEARRRNVDEEIVKVRKLKTLSPSGRRFFTEHLKTLRRLAAMCRKMAKSTQRAMDDA